MTDGRKYVSVRRLHTKDTQTLPVPFGAFPSKHPCDISPSLFSETPGASRRAGITYDEFHHRAYARRDCSHVTRIYPSIFLSRANSPKSAGCVNNRKDGANNRWMCVQVGERGGYCRDRNTPRYCPLDVSREREMTFRISLVLIKKSHKAPPGRDIAAGARYIITMIYRILLAAVRRTFAEAVKED